MWNIDIWLFAKGMKKMLGDIVYDEDQGNIKKRDQNIIAMQMQASQCLKQNIAEYCPPVDKTAAHYHANSIKINT